MPSLLELQSRFAEALRSADDLPPGLAVYRNTVRANQRNALAATYRVVRELVGEEFFAAAADRYAREHPSSSGDLNRYGARLGELLDALEAAAEWPYLGDVARLEWAIDECARGADAPGSASEMAAALAAAGDLPARRLVLHPAARLLRSPHPVMRIWRWHDEDPATRAPVDFDAGVDWLLVRREEGVPVVERLGEAEWTWLRALHAGATVAEALDRALDADGGFDLGGALRRRVVDRTLAALA